MSDYSNQKNNIILSHYDYKRDIENRVIMAQLSVFEVDVLREVLDHSLRIEISDLADLLDVKEQVLLPALKKLTQTKLLTIHGEMINVDKEMRKYYESQIVKFDDDFQPDMEFLQGLLSKLPMHALLNWYSIPNSSSHIFTSIIENYLSTPKVYQRYLSELNFADPILKNIAQDVFNASDYKVKGRTLMDKYLLSREQFEEYMLHLEFNFVCCLGYNQANDVWEEVVTPFYEWSTYLRFQQETAPSPIQEIDKIQRTHPEEDGFLQDLNRILNIVQDDPLQLAEASHGWAFFDENALFALPHVTQETEYLSRVINTLVELELASIKEGILNPVKQTQEWLRKSKHDQKMTLYRHSVNRLCTAHDAFAERDYHETVRSLNHLAKQGWVYFDDYIGGLTFGIGNADSVVLQNKGKKWKYVIPTYSEEQVHFIKTVIFTGLFEAGLIATGTHRGQPCFSMTSFGCTLLT